MIPEKPKIYERKLGKEKPSIKTKANENEKRIAEKLGGKRQSHSGAILGSKGDVKLDKFLLDSKQTSFNSIVVSTDMLSKITKEARGEGKNPAIVITFETPPMEVSKQWVLIELDDFAKMLDNKQDVNL